MPIVHQYENAMRVSRKVVRAQLRGNIDPNQLRLSALLRYSPTCGVVRKSDPLTINPWVQYHGERHMSITKAIFRPVQPGHFTSVLFYVASPYFRREV